jgi:hypothetical protein
VEIDFHFGATYVAARLGGLDHAQSSIVATCAQYVDDTVNDGVVRFKSGQSFRRISSAHAFSDYRILNPIETRLVWIPFHFLPGGDGGGDPSTGFYDQIVCRPHSEVAKAMARLCIEKKQAPHALHRLGITAHVFIDTWAHQGFAGVMHPVNVVWGIQLIDPPEKAPGEWGNRMLRWFWRMMSNLQSRYFPMGHGAALHYPDHPFRKWSYENGLGQTVMRDNPTDFLEAANQLCRFIQRFVKGDPEAEVSGLPAPDREVIRKKIVELTDDDPMVRLEHWLKAIEAGEFSFGPASPRYLASGAGSWKHAALGITSAEVDDATPVDYSQEFLVSDWKRFHDAALAHQYDVLKEILPGFGICAI